MLAQSLVQVTAAVQHIEAASFLQIVRNAILAFLLIVFVIGAIVGGIIGFFIGRASGRNR